MTPEFMEKVSIARKHYLELPAALRPSYLEHLREDDPEVVNELERQIPDLADSALSEETLSYLSKGKERDGTAPNASPEVSPQGSNLSEPNPAENIFPASSSALPENKPETQSQEKNKSNWVPLVVGVVVLVLLAGAGGAAWWYQDFLERKAVAQEKEERERKKRQEANEQDAKALEDVLDKVRVTHEVFDRSLKEPGGVFELHNRRREWTDKLEEARATLSKRGMELLGRLEGDRGEELKKKTDQLMEQLEQDIREWKIAAELGYIRERHMTVVNGEFDAKYALENYPRAFTKAKLELFGDNLKAAVGRIRSMRIRQQVVSSLYDWAMVVFVAQSKTEGAKLLPYVQLQGRLLQVAALVEGEPEVPALKLLQDAKQWAKLRQDQDALKELIDSLPADVSPSHISLVGNLTKQNSAAEKAWLDVAARYVHDFALTLQVAIRLKDRSPREGITNCRAAVSINPSSTVAYNVWGEALMNLERYKEAGEKFQQATKIDPNFAVAHNNWGVALSKSKQYGEAIVKFRRATEIDQSFTSAYNNWGEVLKTQKRYTEAIEKFQKVIEIDENNARAYSNWGGVLIEKKEPQKAIAKFQKAIEIDKTFGPAYTNWGVTLYGLKKYEDANAKFEKAVTFGPGDALDYTNWGNALAALKKYKEAFAKYNEATLRDEKFALAYTNWGLALANLKRYDEAIAKFKKAADIDKNDVVALANWGVVLTNLGRYDEAIAKFEKTIPFDPQFPIVYSTWGKALTRLKRYDEAIVQLQKALNIDKNHAPAYANWGTVLNLRKRYDEAIAKFKKATELEARQVYAYAGWGLALMQLKKYDDAVAKFEKATEIDSRFALAYANWGLCLARQNKLEGAVTQLRKATEFDPTNLPVHVNLGMALMQLKQFEKAIVPLEKAIELKSKLPNVPMLLGLACYQEGKFRKAIGAYKTMQSLLPPGHPLIKQSRQQIKQCEFWLAREKKLPGVLAGREKVSNEEQLAMAALCSQFTKRYQDAVKLYTDVFKRAPSVGEDLKGQPRYNAARAAALAISEKNADAKNLSPKAKTALRQQVLSWLQDDLKAYRARIKANRYLSAALIERMQGWQRAPDLKAFRDKKALSELPEGEQREWAKLWSDVKVLAKEAGTNFNETIFKGVVRGTEVPHRHKMTAGIWYTIDMQSSQFDTLLRLFDDTGNQIDENDDIDVKTNKLNSRLLFRPRKTGFYRIVAGSYRNQGRGSYKIYVREFPRIAAKKSDKPGQKK
ncbi:MAG: tetratricopeptide repeat protein [Gemmataceae bacterium]